MPSDITLSTFPDNAVEGLALLWVKQNAEKGKSPQDLCKMYWETYHQIAACYKDEAKKAKAKFRDC